MKNKAALYIRVSTTDQALHGYSLSAQEELLRRYAEEHDMQVVGVYADEGVSGHVLLEKRQAIMRLLSDAEKGKFAVVLFKDITRWSRNASSYYKCQDILDKAKVGWIAVEQPYLETLTPTGRFQVSVMLGTAQLEAEQTGQRIKFVQEAEIRRGHYPFPKHCAPTGYTTEKREDGNYLVIDQETAPIIRTIFHAFKLSYNLQRCVEAVRSAHGIDYSETTVNRILRNPIYKGEFKGNANFCEPLIAPDEWDALQRPKRAYTANKHRGRYFFTGLCKCALCGSTMRGNAPNDKYFMYSCKQGCHVTITQRELEEKVLAMVRPELDEYKLIVKKRKADNESISLQRKKLIQKRERLTEVFLDGIFDKQEYEKRKQDIDLQLADLEPQPDLPEFKTDFSTMYALLTPEKKCVFWKAFLKDITVHRDRQINLSFHTTKVLVERMGMIDNLSNE